MLDRRQQPLIRPLRPFEVPPPEKRQLANGITLHVFRTCEEEVVRLDILLLGGGQWYQQQPLQAFFANRMLQEGTRTYSAEAIANKLDYYGAWLDLSTSMKHAFITLFSLKKYFQQTLDIVRSMLWEPLYGEQELLVAVEKQRQQFRVNNTKVSVLARKAMNQNLLGAGHPCARYAELADYDRLSREALVRFHTQYYHANNCTLYLSGNVTDEMQREVERCLGASAWGHTMEKRQEPAYTLGASGPRRIVIEREEATQSAVSLGCRTIDQQHPDFPKLRVLITLFGGFFGSRLMKSIREEKGYTYGIGASIQSYPDCSTLLVQTQTTNEQVEPVVAAVYAEMERLQKELVSMEELTMVQHYMMGDLCRSYEGPFSLADTYIYLDTFGLTRDFLAQSQEAIRSITPTDIRYLARTYLQQEAMREVVAGRTTPNKQEES